MKHYGDIININGAIVEPVNDYRKGCYNGIQE